MAIKKDTKEDKWIDNPDGKSSIFYNDALSFLIMNNHFQYKGTWICRISTLDNPLIELKAKDIKTAKEESIDKIKAILKEMMKALQ